MKQIAVVSGKGGTGKTVVTACFAALARQSCLVDCDVDAANLHLMLAPDLRSRHVFESGVSATIDLSKCTRCGSCRDACRFDAISSDYRIDPIACEGCGICYEVCRPGAVDLVKSRCGEWFLSETKYGPLVHARLGIAEENSGKLVTLIRKTAAETAVARGLDMVLIDGPPGIGCPVIATLSGVDLALVVTEPSVSGMHDLDRVLELAAHFGIPAAVMVNKHDLSPENTGKIAASCADRNVSVIGMIPFSPEVVVSVVQGKPLVESGPSAITDSIVTAWRKTCQLSSGRTSDG